MEDNKRKKPSFYLRSVGVISALVMGALGLKNQGEILQYERQNKQAIERSLEQQETFKNAIISKNDRRNYTPHAGDLVFRDLDGNTSNIGIVIEPQFDTQQKEVIAKIYKYLSSKGIDNIHTCGILANIYAESNFHPNSVSDDGNASLGLCQWTGERKKRYIEHINKNGESVESQMEFMLNGEGEKEQTDEYLNTTFNNSYDAATDWCINWERPMNKYEQAKLRGAEAIRFEKVILETIEKNTTKEDRKMIYKAALKQIEDADLKTSFDDEQKKTIAIIYSILRSEGMDHIHSCGILRVIEKESDFDSSAVSHDGFNVCGLLQWTYVRRDALYEFAKKYNEENGTDHKLEDVELQIMYLLYGDPAMYYNEKDGETRRTIDVYNEMSFEGTFDADLWLQKNYTRPKHIKTEVGQIDSNFEKAIYVDLRKAPTKGENEEQKIEKPRKITIHDIREIEDELNKTSRKVYMNDEGTR